MVFLSGLSDLGCLHIPGAWAASGAQMGVGWPEVAQEDHQERSPLLGPWLIGPGRRDPNLHIQLGPPRVHPHLENLKSDELQTADGVPLQPQWPDLLHIPGPWAAVGP